MSKKPGRETPRKKGGVVDMTIDPHATPPYQMPPPEECEEIDGSLVLAPRQELRTRFTLWNESFMVEFAVMQFTKTFGSWEQVSRIDTCHGIVHRHRLTRHSEDDTGDVQLLEVIPSVDGWKVVAYWYDESLRMLENEWHENLRRWKNDPA